MPGTLQAWFQNRPPEPAPGSIGLMDAIRNFANGQTVRGAINGLTAPGRAWQGTLPADQYQQAGSDVANLLNLGGPTEMGAVAGAGLGVPRLWRDMHVDDAMKLLPGSNDHGDAGGLRDLYYASNPDLALGQRGNSGVKMQFDNPDSVLTGRKANSKPMAGVGDIGDEFIASPTGRNGFKELQGSVGGFEIDKAKIGQEPRSTQIRMQRYVDQLRQQGWDVNDTGKTIKVERPRALSDNET